MSRSLYARLTRCYAPQPSRIERREFLRVALAASAGLLISSDWSLARTETRRIGSKRRVVVIGAGFGGLACAHELLSAGYEVTVLESRDRIGGRVISFRDIVPGKVVEGGGELIGSNHPTWMAYAKKFGLRFNDVTENDDLFAPVILGGKRLTPNESKALWKEMESAYKLMNRDAAAIDPDQPWRSANARQLDGRSSAQWIRALPVSDLCRRAITVDFTADNGNATSRQSYLGNLSQVKGGGLEKYWTESEVYRCAGGNAQLARKLAAALGDERIWLGNPVREIHTTPGKTFVRDAAGRIFDADDIVLAVPPSTWRSIQFTPPLPRVLRPQMGVNVKFLASVKRRFWRRSGLAPDSTSDGIVSMTWEGTDNQGSDADGAALTAFSGGFPAERARQQWAAQGDEAYIAALSKIYPEFRENFVRGRFMNWPNERWTAAGYSFPAPGQVTTVAPILHSGLGRLQFAGEHTCLKFVGYMEGALNSGVSLARRIAARDAGAALPTAAGAAC